MVREVIGSGVSVRKIATMTMEMLIIVPPRERGMVKAHWRQTEAISAPGASSSLRM